MKRGIKYALLIGLMILVSALLERLEVRPGNWLVDTLYSAAGTAPAMLLFYTAGHDPKLKGIIPVYARILFWLFGGLFILGRIVPYIP